MGMIWIKMYPEMLDDVKFKRVPESTKWRFVQLLLLAGECDAAGAFVSGAEPMTIDDIAWRLRIDAKTCTEDIEILIGIGVLIWIDGILTITRFSDRQGPTQEEKREAWNNRQRRRRDRSKPDTAPQTEEQPAPESDLTPENVTRDTRVTHALDIDIEKNKNQNQNQNNNNNNNSADAEDEGLPDDLGSLQVAFINASKLPFFKVSADDRLAYQDMFKMGATPEDISAAVRLLLDKYGGAGVRSPSSLLKTVPLVIAERKRAAEGIPRAPTSIKKPYASTEERVRDIVARRKAKQDG